MELTITDFANLLQLVRRATFVGLDEAQAAVALSNKLQARVLQMQKKAEKKSDVEKKEV